jgi:hypothetical protein
VGPRALPSNPTQGRQGWRETKRLTEGLSEGLLARGRARASLVEGKIN